jgi:hypothetical protein
LSVITDPLATEHLVPSNPLARLSICALPGPAHEAVEAGKVMGNIGVDP